MSLIPLEPTSITRITDDNPAVEEANFQLLLKSLKRQTAEIQREENTDLLESLRGTEPPKEYKFKEREIRKG